MMPADWAIATQGNRRGNKKNDFIENNGKHFFYAYVRCCAKVPAYTQNIGEQAFSFDERS
jgi:hypothetical protein